MTSLDDFLATGRLGPVAEGRTMPEVRDLLGEPEAASVPDWPQVWKYGALQLGFHRESRDEPPFLVFIGLYFRHEDETLPAALGLSGWLPAPGCTYAAFRRHLDEIGLKPSGGVESGPNKHLVIGPGVRVAFDADVLDSIQYSAKREPRRKQLGISIDRRAYEAIRSEARARGVSVSDLCSRWIEEQAEMLARGAGSAVP